MTDNISEIVVATLVQWCQGILMFFSRILRALIRAFITDGHFEFCEKRTVAYFCSHFSRASLRLSTSTRYETTLQWMEGSGKEVFSADSWSPWPLAYLQIIARCSASKKKFFVSLTTVHSMCLRWFRSDCTLLPNIHAPPTGPWRNEYHQKSK